MKGLEKGDVQGHKRVPNGRSPHGSGVSGGSLGGKALEVQGLLKVGRE